jgi:hypothetical protein
VTEVARYLVELPRPRRGWEEIQSLTATARAAAEGTDARLLRSVFVPEDGHCLLVYEGVSRAAVARAARRAGIRIGRVSAALREEER